MNVSRTVVGVLVGFPATLLVSFVSAAAVVVLLHPPASTSHVRVALDRSRASAALPRFEPLAARNALHRPAARVLANEDAARSPLVPTASPPDDVDLYNASRAHGHVFVVEPLESQLGPEWFMSAPPGRVLPTGERLSRWPIYGAIVGPSK